MKKLVVIIISLMCVNVVYAGKNVKSVEQLEGGGVKFHLEDKEKPSTPLDQISGEECWEKILREIGVPSTEYNIKRLDTRDSNLVYFDHNACFEGFLTAFDKLWAGFIGMEMDWENRTIKPSISWMMRESSDRDKAINLLGPEDLGLLKQAGENGEIDYMSKRVYGTRCTYNNEQALFACRFPLFSMAENYNRYDTEGCKTHVVVSLKEITIPSDLGEWCRKNNIEHLIVKAPMSDAQKEDILRQFPAAELVAL